MVYKRELQPTEVYSGTSFDRAIASLNRFVNQFRCSVPKEVYDMALGTTHPDLVLDAYFFASIKHDGQTRFDGGPYMRHPVDVAKILYSAGIRQAGIIAPAFLHDVIEGERDRKIGNFEKLMILATRGQQELPPPGSLEEIKEKDRRCKEALTRKFGWAAVVSIVETLTPLPKSHYTKGQRDTEMHKRLEDIGSYDLRPHLIKGADSLQNLLPREIMLMENQRAIDYAEYSKRLLWFLQANLPELGWYSNRGEEGIKEGIITPLEQRINAVIAERSARLAEKRKMEPAAAFAEFVPAN